MERTWYEWGTSRASATADGFHDVVVAPASNAVSAAVADPRGTAQAAFDASFYGKLYHGEYTEAANMFTGATLVNAAVEGTKETVSKASRAIPDYPANLGTYLTGTETEARAAVSDQLDKTVALGAVVTGPTSGVGKGLALKAGDAATDALRVVRPKAKPPKPSRRLDTVAGSEALDPPGTYGDGRLPRVDASKGAVGSLDDLRRVIADSPTGATAINGAEIGNISSEAARRIQATADSSQKTIVLFGSRAKGTADEFSDWDYLVTGANSKFRKKAHYNKLPKGSSKIDREGNPTDGWDIMDIEHSFVVDELLPSETPMIIFNPRQK